MLFNNPAFGGLIYYFLVAIFILTKIGRQDAAGQHSVAVKAVAATKGVSYLISLTADGAMLTADLTNLASSATETLSATATGAVLMGKTVSLNGQGVTADTVYFDDFSIEIFE